MQDEIAARGFRPLLAINDSDCPLQEGPMTAAGVLWKCLPINKSKSFIRKGEETDWAKIF